MTGLSDEPLSPPPPPSVSRRWRLWLAVVIALIVVDIAQPPRRQISARALVGAINVYQATLSRAMPSMGVRCRFQPTCSHYAERAISQHGSARGTALTAWRVLRCGPWTNMGTFDPPPHVETSRAPTGHSSAF